MKNTPKRLWVVLALLSFAGILRATLPQTTVGTWTSASNLGQARANAAAVMLSDSRILITGGDAGSGPLQSAEIFGTNGSASAAGAMNVARSGHFAVVLSDGRVLAGGGNSSGGGATNSAEIYDPSSDTWTQTSSMTQARAGATAALLQDGRVLIAGGDNSGTPSNTIEVFDPSSGEFSFAGTLSSPRTKHAMAVLQDGRVLIVGGSDGTNPLASSDIYDPSSGNVTAGPALSTARYSASATTLLDGRIVVIGGAGREGADLASAEIYDPASGAFSNAGAALATAREGHQAFLLPNNNSVLIVGGTSGATTVAASELFIPQISSAGVWSSSFSASGANVTARSAAVGSSMKQPGLLLAAGGNDASGNGLASTELYAFPTVKTDQADYAPGTVVTITGSGWQPGETVTLSLVEAPLIDTHPTMTAVADANGNISNNQFSPDAYDVDVKFYLTAVGSQSGLVALNTFTDAAGDTSNVTISCTPNPVSVNNPTTCTGTVANTESGAPNGFPHGTVKFGLIGTGTAGTFTPSNTCTVLQIDSTHSACSVVLTPTAGVSGSVSGNFNSADQNKWKNNNSNPDFNLTISATVATSLGLAEPSPSSVLFGSVGPVTFRATLTRTTGGVAVSGATVNFMVDGTAVGSAVTNSTGVASFATYNPSALSVGGHNIQASFAGATITGTTYISSTSTLQTLTVTQASQTITFGALPDKTYGDALFTVSATGGASGIPVMFTAVPSGVCTSGGTNGSDITITGAGGCTVTAHQAGNTNYAAAADVPQSFTVNRANPTVTGLASNCTYTGSTCSTGSGSAKGVNNEDLGAVTLTYSGTDNAGASFGPSSTGPINAGSYQVVAHYAQSMNYNAANSVPALFAVNRAKAAINVVPYSVIYDGNPHTATGTATGVLNESLTGLNLTGTTHTNPGDYASDAWTFTDITGNYMNASGGVHDAITFGVCSVGPGGVILPPINSDGTSVYQRKGSSTIPVKFRVCGANGMAISNPALVFAPAGATITLLSAVRGTIDNVNENSTTDVPDVAFRWDSSGQQWIFNMATSNLTAGSTDYFRINLTNASQSILFAIGVK